MNSIQVWYWRQMATWSRFFKRDAMALEYWERIAGARPDDPSVLVALAHHHAEAGARARAIELLGQSLLIDGNQPVAQFNLGFLLQEDGRHGEAIIAFDKAIELRENLDQAHYGRALSLVKLDRQDEAIESLKRNIALQPLSPYGYYQLAHVYHRRQDSDSVRRVLRQLAAFEPQVARQLERETGISIGLDES